MKTTAKSFAVGLLIILVVLAAACRTKKTQPPVVAPATTDTAPVVPPPPATQTVATDTDFVRTETSEPMVREDALPADIEEANRTAQQRGYIQDAFFGYDESALSADAQSALQHSADWLKRNTQYNLLVEGHCDERGTEQYNLALGDRRAHIVKEYLSTLGVDASRIRTVSYGEERPFDPGHDESAWQHNRRGHLVLVGK